VKIEDKVVGEVNAAFLLRNSNDSSFITNSDYSLYKSTLLDSGTVDIFNDLSRFQEFRKAPRNHVVRCGNHFARVLGMEMSMSMSKKEINEASLELKMPPTVLIS